MKKFIYKDVKSSYQCRKQIQSALKSNYNQLFFILKKMKMKFTFDEIIEFGNQNDR